MKGDLNILTYATTNETLACYIGTTAVEWVWELIVI